LSKAKCGLLQIIYFYEYLFFNMLCRWVQVGAGRCKLVQVGAGECLDTFYLIAIKSIQFL